MSGNEGCWNKESYTDCYVAFLDILGFRDEVLLKGQCKDILEIFRGIRDYGSNMKRAGEQTDIAKVGKAAEDLRIKIMSDSIVFAILVSVEYSLSMLLYVTGDVQGRLMEREERRIFTRGGIARGEFYIDEDIMFGEGLVRAYELEGEAKYPRVIIKKEVTNEYLKRNIEDEGKKKRHYVTMLQSDEIYDKQIFVTSWAKVMEEDRDKKIAFRKSLIAYSEKIMEEGEEGIREKYEWLKKHLIEDKAY